MWSVVNAIPLSPYSPERDLIFIVQEAGLAPGSTRTGEEILASPPTGIRSPDRPARSESLLYPDPQECTLIFKNVILNHDRNHIHKLYCRACTMLRRNFLYTAYWKEHGTNPIYVFPCISSVTHTIPHVSCVNILYEYPCLK
jgi:hypothetical protein